MAAGRLVQDNLTEFFRDLLRDGMRRSAVQPSEETEFYLVKLLEGFSRPERGWFDRPLAVDYLESFHSDVESRYGKLKRVGDTALFLSGIFMESLHRRLVSGDYYIRLGRTAYGHLAHFASGVGPTSGDSFAELADRFPEFADVLAHISLERLFPGDEHVLRVYTRWLYTRRERDERWLMKKGLIPYAPPGERRH